MFESPPNLSEVFQKTMAQLALYARSDLGCAAGVLVLCVLATSRSVSDPLAPVRVLQPTASDQGLFFMLRIATAFGQPPTAQVGLPCLRISLLAFSIESAGHEIQCE